jgi:hypothetical protein
MRLTTALFLALLAGALGCGRIREVRGCRALARVVNPALDDISERMAKDRGPGAYRYAATRYRKLASDLKAFHLGIPRAEKSVEDLRSAMTDASTQAQKLAEALDQRDAVIAASARRDLGHVARVQKSVVLRIESDCDG